MMALGEKILYLSDDGIGIFFGEGGNPDQIPDRMGSLRGGMRTNAQKMGYLPPSRQLWERKYTVFKCMQDCLFAGCQGLSPVSSRLRYRATMHEGSPHKAICSSRSATVLWVEGGPTPAVSRANSGSAADAVGVGSSAMLGQVSEARCTT